MAEDSPPRDAGVAMGAIGGRTGTGDSLMQVYHEGTDGFLYGRNTNFSARGGPAVLSNQSREIDIFSEQAPH